MYQEVDEICSRESRFKSGNLHAAERGCRVYGLDGIEAIAGGNLPDGITRSWLVD